jgi:signal transduction histidine kinase
LSNRAPVQPRPILSVHIAQETDFLLARQRAKQIARLVHFDVQDQTRIATAVSEIARNAFEHGKGGRVEFFLDTGDAKAPAMRIVVADQGGGIPHLDAIWSGTYKSAAGMGIGLIGARRLMDALDVETSPAGTIVTLAKRLPKNGPQPPSIAELSSALARQSVEQSNVLLDQNQELLRLLSEIRSREAELRVLNEELAETNRGVLVLYAELEDKARAVQQASETKTRFLSGVTHELRTPLNSIVSLSRLMLAHADGPLTAEQEKQAHFILRSAMNMTEMVNDLLDLARIEAGKATTNLTHFSVAELYAGLRGMFRPLATNPDVKLIFEIPNDPLPLYTDEGKLAQILRNFISNALKFTERGTVTVSAQPHPPMPGASNALITFAVTDTGVGIAGEHHELVMQEWGQIQQAPQPGQSRHKGSGLGLPLSKSFAELLGGSIDFTSAPGQGSTFRLTLPALELSTAPLSFRTLSAEKGEESVSASKPIPEILVVDGNEVARYLLCRQLSAFTTATIVEAASGQQALEAIHRNQPEIVFVHLSLPDMSGLEVARLLRQDPATVDLPIVLNTSRTLTPEERRTLECNDLTLITRRTDRTSESGAPDDSTVQIERALLQIGLSTMHEENEGAPS